jgi:hypothetical protein
LPISSFFNKAKDLLKYPTTLPEQPPEHPLATILSDNLHSLNTRRFRERFTMTQAIASVLEFLQEFEATKLNIQLLEIFSGIIPIYLFQINNHTGTKTISSSNYLGEFIQ